MARPLSNISEQGQLVDVRGCSFVGAAVVRSNLIVDLIEINKLER
jgi:hypothetical protein